MDIIIKTFLRPQALLRLLRSIVRFYPQAHVTIADDGSLREATDPDSRTCCTLIDEVVRFTLLSLPFGVGVVAGRNALVDRTARPYLLLLDDDFIFTSETRIDRLFARLQADPEVGVAAGACIDIDQGHRRPRNSGGTLDRQGDTLTIDTKGWRDEQRKLREYVPHFALIRREVFSRVRWDLGLGGEHYDFCLQLQESGWKVSQDHSVLIDHDHFSPTLPGYAQRRNDCEASRQALLRKWNLRRIVQDGQVILERTSSADSHEAARLARGSPSSNRLSPEIAARTAAPAPEPAPQHSSIRDISYFDFVRPEVADLVPATARRILDIGCGAGRLGEFLKRRQPAEVVGIEMVSLAVGPARERLDQVIEGNIEDGVAFPDGRFDCVICADVLEHLREPMRVLERMRRWLTPDGTLVASIPNVRNHAVVSALLDGNWTYEAAGLLDHDHVRFFTRREIEKLLDQAGFEIEAMINLPDPGLEYDQWRRQGRQGAIRLGAVHVAGLRPDEVEEFLTYQFLIVSHPHPWRVRDQQRVLEALSRESPWPDRSPVAPISTDRPPSLKPLLKEASSDTLNDRTELVVELGAGFGLSTRFIATVAPRARVIAVDPWDAGVAHPSDAESHPLPKVYETFLTTCWQDRDRIIPLRMTIRDALRRIASLGLQPDVIFVNAGQAAETVRDDLALCRKLFPHSQILGNAEEGDGGRRAAESQAAKERMSVGSVGTGWRLARTAETPFRRPRVEHGLTSIVIPTFNEIGYTVQCVNSLLQRTAAPYELIFVDNGSTDGTPRYLQSLIGAKVICNAENRGFAKAVNQGIQVARGENVVLLNNDTVLTTGWLRRLIDVLRSDPRIGLAGPCTNRISGEQQVPVSYCELGTLDGFAWDWGKRHAGLTKETDRLIGFCLAIKRELIDEIGLMDERFEVGCFEDDDYCRRAILAGWKAVIAREAFIHHFSSRTFIGQKINHARAMEVNHRKYEEKWGTPGGGAAWVPPGTPKAAQKPKAESGKPEEVRSSECEVRSDVPPAEIENPKSKIENPHPAPNAAVAPVAPAPADVIAQHTLPRLSLCMIVRDNETTIRPCLESVRPWVDEIVVVDTGSKDRTPEICREYGARLFHFPWCDDFSAARNESLQHARGEWLFWMDSDDTIPETCGSRLRSLVCETHDPSLMGYVMQVHCPSAATDGCRDVTVVDHIKLIRNRSDIRFEGRIHEQLLPSIRRAGGNVAWSDLYVVHSGSDHSQAGWEHKLERDLRILHLELRDQPQHPFVLFNLGMTYADARRYGEAVDYLQRCLAVSGRDESHVGKAYALLVSSLSQSERHAEAWEVSCRGLELFPDDKELLFRSAMLHHHFGRLQAAAETYERVLAPAGERRFQSIDQGLANYKAAHNLAIVYEEMGELERAGEQWRSVVETAPDFLPGWRALGDLLLRRSRWDLVEQEIERLLAKDGPLRREGLILRGRLAGTRNDLPAALRDLEEADHLPAPEDPEACRWKCRLLFEQGTAEQAEAALEELSRRAPEDASTWHNLGVVYSRRRKSEAAVDAYRKSVELRPRVPETWLQLGWALRTVNRVAEAVRAWQHVLELAPRHAEALAALRAAGATDGPAT